ncbi:MAG: hypothetical protein IJF72_02280 [Clostridia bacterium]|nr:hypothetical protein [Clostridia bacterium]
MSKKSSIVLLSILVAVLLFVGVCSLLPDDLAYGKYEEYHAAVNLITKGIDLGDSKYAVLTLDQGDLSDEDYATIQKGIVKTAQKRLAKLGVNSYSLKWEGEDLTVTVPDDGRTTSVFGCVEALGEFDFFSGSTYSETGAFITNEHITRASKQRYSYQDQSLWILTFHLNAEGKEEVKSYRTISSLYMTVDNDENGMQQFSCAITEDSVQIYLAADEESTVNLYIALIAGGSYLQYAPEVEEGEEAYEIELIQIDNDDATPSFANGWLICSIALAVVLVAVCAVLCVRYGVLGGATTLSIYTALLAGLLFSAFVYFNALTVWSFVALLVVIAVIAYLSIDSFANIQANYATGKTVKAAVATGFNKSIVKNLIVNGALAVLGVILWVIPTVTAFIGIVFVYGAILSVAATLGLNRLFVALLYPIHEENNAKYGLSK